LVLGLLPILSPERLMRRFGPLADYLSGTLDVPVVLETAPDYREFVKRTAGERRYDLLFTAPHFYYLAERDAGYRVVVRVSGPRMSAVIVVLETSRIFTLKDLRGSSVATPDSLSLGALLIRHSLIAAGLDPGVDVDLLETPTHNASLLSAVKGFSDAAGLMVVPFGRAAPEIREQVRVIAQTASTTQMPFSVAPWVSEDQAEAFAAAMVNLSSTPEGQALMKHLGWPGFMRAQYGDYDMLESFSQIITIE
jgi:phosphonate transport system substrate-binding protein